MYYLLINQKRWSFVLSGMIFIHNGLKHFGFYIMWSVNEPNFRLIVNLMIVVEIINNYVIVCCWR